MSSFPHFLFSPFFCTYRRRNLQTKNTPRPKGIQSSRVKTRIPRNQKRSGTFHAIPPGRRKHRFCERNHLYQINWVSEELFPLAQQYFLPLCSLFLLTLHLANCWCLSDYNGGRKERGGIHLGRVLARGMRKVKKTLLYLSPFYRKSFFMIYFSNCFQITVQA